MKCIALVTCVTLFLASSAAVWAQQPSPSGHMVSFEVVIAEFAKQGKQRPALEGSDPEKLLAQLHTLEQQGKIDLLTRVSLTTLDQQQASVQVGERRAVVSGRTQLAQRAGAEGLASYTMTSLGTLVSVTPRITDDGTVVAELTVEKTHQPPAPAADADREQPRPPRTVTIQSKSTVHLAPGETVLAGGAQSSGNEESGQMLVLVSARVKPGPPIVPKQAALPPEGQPGTQPKTPAAPAKQLAPAANAKLVVIALKNAQAGKLAEIVEFVFDDGSLHVVADDRSNSLIVQGSTDQVHEIEALVANLDGPATAGR